MKKAIGIISAVYALFLPYIILSLISFLFDDIENMTRLKFILFLVLIILACGLGVLACVMYNYSAYISLNERTAAIYAIILRICHLPAHVLMILVFMGFLNPFLLIVSWVPLAVSFILLVYSGCMNVGACITLFKKRRCSLMAVVIYIVLSFIYIVNIIAAFFQAYSAFESDEVKKWKGNGGVLN